MEIESRDELVLEKGDVIGHTFHGNQHTGGIGGTALAEKPHLQYIANKANAFFGAGGTITRYRYDSKSRYGDLKDGMTSIRDQANTIAEKVGTEVKVMGRGVSTTRLVAHNDETWRRLSEIGGAYERAGIYNNDLLVARNSDGQIVGAMDFNPHGSNYEIGVVGALEGAEGAGTALEYEVARLAAIDSAGVMSTTEFNSAPYHQAIGRQFEGYSRSAEGSNWHPTTTPVNGDKSFWTADQVKEIAAIQITRPSLVEKGDKAGHEFHGNQHTGGIGGSGKNFIGLKTTEIEKVIRTNPYQGKGKQNKGISIVQLKDGSHAVVKTCRDEFDAMQEVLAAKVGKVLDSPIRDAQLVPGSKTEVMSPLVEGQTVIEKGDAYKDTPIDPRLTFLDDVIGNQDRNPGNIIISPDGKQQIGIDHSTSFPMYNMDHLTPDFTEMGNPTKDQIMTWTKGLESLKPDFQQNGLNYNSQFESMMSNWKTGAVSYMAANGML